MVSDGRWPSVRLTTQSSPTFSDDQVGRDVGDAGVEGEHAGTAESGLYGGAGVRVQSLDHLHGPLQLIVLDAEGAGDL